MGVQPVAVPQNLALAFTTAGDRSDVDFNYLLDTAVRESSLDPKAKAGSSSATGLFQFLDSTWLRVMKQEGPRLGYGTYADAIEKTSGGDYVVPDKTMRAKILKLREDPQVASDLAAAYTRSNGAYLLDKFGRMPSPGELYIAHFLGAQGAEQLFKAGLDDPNQSAAALFPRQAKANPTIFYHDGKARSVKDLYRALVAQHDSAAPTTDPAFAAQQLASGTLPAPDDVQQVAAAAGATGDDTPTSRWADKEIPSRFGPGDMSFNSLFSNEQEVPGRVLMSRESESVGPALFTSFYGQAAGQPLVPMTPPAVTASTPAAPLVGAPVTPVGPDLPMPPPPGVNDP